MSHGGGGGSGRGAAAAAPPAHKKRRVGPAPSTDADAPLHLPEARMFEILADVERRVDFAVERQLDQAREELQRPRRTMKMLSVILSHTLEVLDTEEEARERAQAKEVAAKAKREAEAALAGKVEEGDKAGEAGSGAGKPKEGASGAGEGAGAGSGGGSSAGAEGGDKFLERHVRWTIVAKGKYTGGATRHSPLFLMYFKRFLMELPRQRYGDQWRAEWVKAGAPSIEVYGHTMRGIKDDVISNCVVDREGDRIIVTRETYQPLSGSVSAQGFLYFGEKSAQMLMSPALAPLVGSPVATKSNALLAVWAHAKAHNLIDAQNPTIIHPDDALQRLFGIGNREYLSVQTLDERISRLVSPSPPLRLAYSFNLDKLTGNCIWEIPVEVPDPVVAHWQLVLDNSDRDWERDRRELEVLAMQMQDKVAALNAARLRREYLLGFSSDPVGFFHRLLESQTRDLAVMTDGLGDVSDEIAEQDPRLFSHPRVFEAVERHLLHTKGLPPKAADAPHAATASAAADDDI